MWRYLKIITERRDKRANLHHPDNYDSTSAKRKKKRDTGTLKIFLFTLYLQIINRIIVSDLRKGILK